MKVLAAAVISFLCYSLGHGISRVMNNRFLYWLYPAYNRLMLWSSGAEEWAGIDLMWGRPDEDYPWGGTSSDD